MKHKLGPLPEPETRTDFHIDGCGDPAFTPHQMHAYATQEVAAAVAPLEAKIAELEESYGRACKLVVDMHAAATGNHGFGPTRGVLEDVEDARKDADRYRRIRDEDGMVEFVTHLYWNTETADEFDAAIDAAMGEKL